MHEEKFRGGCGSAGAAGQRTNAVWPNGTGATYVYDDAGQLLSLVHRTASGSPIASFEYAYDIAGNRTNMITLEGLHAFSYDNRNQLVGAVYPDGSSEEFAYDLVGNRTSLVAVSTNGATNTTYYTYASGNRLVADASETATNTYAYDGAGRLTNHVVNGQTRTFTYDFQGRMTSLTDIDGSEFAYEFDGEGNRLSQNLNDCLSKRFVYDGADVLLELNPTNGVACAWVNGPGIDQPIERLLFIDGTPRARRVFHADALGSIAALTDPSGLVTQSYSYAAFGSLRSVAGSDLNRVTYTGREQLGDSQGWMYYRHRVYDPKGGAFLSADPLNFKDGNNVWGYCHNNPVIFEDPWGLETYLVNRKLGGGMPKPRSNLATHTLVATKSAVDGVIDIYEWGTAYDGWVGLWGDSVLGGRNLDETVKYMTDVAVARTAIQQGLAQRVGDDAFDPYVAMAYQILHDSQASRHWWLPWSNCKTEAWRLIKKARELQRKDMECEWEKWNVPVVW